MVVVTGSEWEVVGLVVVGLVVVGLFDLWRRPEVACWRCGGASWVRGLTWVFGRATRGACRSCGGDGWRQRRMSGWFGWTRDTHR